MSCERKIHEEYLEFQPDSVELEERPVPRAARFTAYGMVLFVLAVIIWSIVAKVDRVVTTRGKLITTAQNIVLQPLNASVIKAFLVEEGQEVVAGQELVVLDPTFTQADLDELAIQKASYEAQARRLECELDGREYPCAESVGPEAEVALQADIFRQRRQEYASRLESYDKNITALEAEIHTYLAERDHAEQQRELSAEVESMHSQVLEEEAISRIEYLDARRELMDVDTMIERLSNQVLERQEELKRVRAEREAFINAWVAEASQELVDVRRQLESLSQQLNKAQRLNELVVLRAPADAVVLSLADYSVGSVVDTAQPVVTLVPLNAPLLAEVEIRPQDIGFVRLDDSTRIKLDAFPFQRHGVVMGTISFLSEDVFQQQTAQGNTLNYHGKVALGEIDLRDVPADFRLIPGMTLTAEIKVGSRRIITYFLYPIIRAFDESMREP